jgi:hypothetical protein
MLPPGIIVVKMVQERRNVVSADIRPAVALPNQDQ